MKKLFVLALLCLLCLTSKAQLSLNARNVFESDGIQIINEETSKKIFTRQNSASIILSNFSFAEPKNGDFVVNLKVSILGYLPGNANPITKSTFSILFDDVIKNIEGGKSITLGLMNKPIGMNISLKDANFMKVELRLIKVKQEYQSVFETFSPMLNVTATTSNAVQTIENVIKAISSNDQADQLIFSNNYYIPLNSFEYNTLNEERKIQVLENDQDVAIGISGAYPISDNSLWGISKNALNRIVKFVVGNKVVDPATAKLSGFISLYITKNSIQILPANITASMETINDNLISAIVGDNSQDINFHINLIRNWLDSSPSDLDATTKFSIKQYLGLATIYNLFNKDPNSGDWIQRLRAWSTTMNQTGNSRNVELYGIKDMYPSIGTSPRYAPVYLPYALSDDQNIAMVVWQKNMHATLATLPPANHLSIKASVSP
jgi:hypothetical protein